MVKALLIHDMERENDRGTVRWAYANRTHGLKKYAPPGWEVDRISIPQMLGLYREQGQDHFIEQYDVVLNMDYQSATTIRSVIPASIPMISSFNKDRSANTEYWKPCYTVSDYVICNNRDRYEWALQEGYEQVCYIANGVDTDFWRSDRPFSERAFDVAWCGSSATKKRKGYGDIVSKLPELMPDLKMSIRPVMNSLSHDIYCAEDQREWYSHSKVFLCVSETEGGGPSSLMEAMACGCVPVAVRIGSVPEFGANGVNCCIVDRTLEDVIAGIRQVLADEDPDSLSFAAQDTMRRSYAYGTDRGPDKWFYRVMERVSQRFVLPPFDYQETTWETL